MNADDREARNEMPPRKKEPAVLLPHMQRVIEHLQDGDDDDEKQRKWRSTEEESSLDLWPDARPAQRKYLYWLAETGSEYHAIKYSRITIRCVRRWREKKPDFVIWELEASEMAVHMLEGFLRKRAKDGSDRLLMMALQAAMPAKYGQQVKLTMQALPDKKIELLDRGAGWALEAPLPPTKEPSDGGGS